MHARAAWGFFVSLLMTAPAVDSLGETPPGDQPVVFARGTVSDDGHRRASRN
jgi:hypothetical protein